MWIYMRTIQMKTSNILLLADSWTLVGGNWWDIFIIKFQIKQRAVNWLSLRWDLADLKNVAGHGATAARPPGLLPVQIILTGRFWQRLPGHEVHHRGLARGQAQRRQRHVPVQEPALVYQSEYFCFGHLNIQKNNYKLIKINKTVHVYTHRFIFPLLRPVIKDKLCNVPGTLAWTEQILLGLAADQD